MAIMWINRKKTKTDKELEQKQKKNCWENVWFLRRFNAENQT